MRINQLALPFIAATAVAVSSPAAAAGPPIAYAKESRSSFDLFLTDASGNGTVKLYSSASKISIGIVEMNPTANELAIVESRSTGFKIIRYTDAGVRTATVPVNDGCLVQGLDYHPSDGSLLVSRYCNATQVSELRRYSNGAYASSALVTVSDPQNEAIGTVRWLGDGTGFVLARASVGSGSTIDRYNLSNTGAPTTIWSSSNLAMPAISDTARCSTELNAACSKLLYNDQSSGLHQVHFDDFGGTDEGVILTGSDGHYSPNNIEILYRFQVKGGYELRIAGPSPRTLAPKAGYAGKDWRP